MREKGQEKLLGGGVIRLRQEGARKRAYQSKSYWASGRVVARRSLPRPRLGRTPRVPCLRAVLSLSPLALTVFKCPPPAITGLQQSCVCALQQSARWKRGRLPEVWPLVPCSRFPSGVVAVFRVFLTGLSTPFFFGDFLVFRFLLPPRTSHTLASPVFSSVAPPRPPHLGFRLQFGTGARPSPSAGHYLLLAGAKATTARRRTLAAPALELLGGQCRLALLSLPQGQLWVSGFRKRKQPRRPRSGGRGSGNFSWNRTFRFAWEVPALFLRRPGHMGAPPSCCTFWRILGLLSFSTRFPSSRPVLSLGP